MMWGEICRENGKCKDSEAGTRLNHARTERRPVCLKLSDPEKECVKQGHRDRQGTDEGVETMDRSSDFIPVK